MKKYDDFIVWRGIAILWIVIAHVLQQHNIDYSVGINRPIFHFISASGIPLNIFFIQSGFLVTGRLLESKIGSLDFLGKRLMKLLPHYLILVLAVLVLNFVSFPVIKKKQVILTKPTSYTVIKTEVDALPQGLSRITAIGEDGRSVVRYGYCPFLSLK
ncbi:MAG: acyltransferase family protein [Thermodesulfovibrionales bacterium]|nr:acyltransferase family protein [Thermodesulfovibrionales bacterium]